jgi:hypothetical protein
MAYYDALEQVNTNNYKSGFIDFITQKLKQSLSRYIAILK